MIFARRPQPEEDAPPRWPVASMLLLFLLACAALAPTLQLGHFADDWFQVQHRSWSVIASTLVGDWNVGERGIGGFYRPVVRLSFALEGIASAHNPAFSHEINGALFLVLMAAVGRVAALLAPRSRSHFLILPALILLLHPLKSEALLWVSGRTDLLATTFTMLAFAVFLEWLARGGRGLAIAWLALLLLALGSKETAVAAGLILPIAAAILTPRDQRRRRLAGVLIPLVLLAIYIVFRGVLLGGLAGYSGAAPRQLSTILTSIATATGALWWPWQPVDGPVYMVPAGIVIAVLASLAILLVSRARTHVVLLLAQFAAMLPICLVVPSPVDGSRLLLLPLCVQIVLVCVMLRSLPSRAVLLGLALTLLPSQLAVWRQYRDATPASASIAKAAIDEIGALTPGTVCVLPMPLRTEPRRILDPGLALDQAVIALSLADDAKGSVRAVAERGALGNADDVALGLTITASGREQLIAYQLQPWMREQVVVLQPRMGSLVRRDLQFVDEVTSAGIVLTPEASGLIVGSIDDGMIGAVECISHRPVGRAALMRVYLGDRLLEESPLLFFPAGGVWVAHGATLNSPPIGGRRIELISPDSQIPFPLQSMVLSRYQIQNSERLPR